MQNPNSSKEKRIGTNPVPASRTRIALSYLLVTLGMLWLAILFTNRGTAVDFQLLTFLFWMSYPLYGGMGLGLAGSLISVVLTLALVGSLGLSLFYRKRLPFLITYGATLAVVLSLGYIAYAFRNG